MKKMLSNNDNSLLRGAMPTLYLLCDYWEPSLSRAAHEARNVKNHTIHMSHIISDGLHSSLAPLCEEMELDDLILISVLNISKEQFDKVALILKHLPPEKVTKIKLCHSRYSHKMNSLTIHQRILVETNNYEAPRNTSISESKSSNNVTVKERCWIQYRLMRALISGDEPKVVFENIIQNLLSNTFSKQQMLLAQNFHGQGEPDMAGGQYADKRKNNPNSIDLLRERAVQVGRSGLNALIIGETGTGKESIAWYLHDFSERNTRNFIALNCAFFEGERLESELFGHEQGAFTDAKKAKKGLVEIANGGTVFLDELPEMASRVQAKLLRFLEDGSYTRMGGTQIFNADVRIVSAAQPERMENLRADLYHRVADVELYTTPLRLMKKNDVVNIACNLAYRLMWRTVQDENGKVILTPDIICESWKQLALPQNAVVLASYHWPGNMRELSNMIKRYVLLKDNIFEELKLKTLRRSASNDKYKSCFDETWASFIQPIPDIETVTSLGLKLNELQGAFIRNLVANFGGRQKVQLTKLAKLLDCSYNTLNKHL